MEFFDELPFQWIHLFTRPTSWPKTSSTTFPEVAKAKNISFNISSFNICRLFAGHEVTKFKEHRTAKSP